jgi:hypothetical protein
MPITIAEAAARLDGNEYLHEGSPELWAEMKAAGLVAVFGASDDLMEFRGAIGDEASAYGGFTASVSRGGLIANRCDDEDCPYFAQKHEKGAKVKAVWSESGDEPPWTMKTALPHATFKIMEDGEVFCIGLVFSLADCPEV